MSPDQRQLGVILFIVMIVQVVVTMAMLAVAVLAPILAISLGIGAHLVGYQVALTYVFCAISSAISGGLVSRYGPCRVTQSALVLVGIGCGFISLGSIETIAFGSLLIGVGYGMTNPAASHLLFLFTPAPRRNLVFSIKQTGVPLGGVLLGLVLPPVAETFSWQIAVIGIAILTLVTAAAMSPLRPRWDIKLTSARLRIRGAFDGPLQVWRIPPIRWLCFCSLCFGAVQMSLMTFTVVLLVEDFVYSLVFAGSVLSAVQASGAVGRVFWGGVADRLGGTATLVVIGILMTLGALTVANLRPDTPSMIAIVTLVLYGGVAIGWNGVVLAEAARMAPVGNVATITGGMMAFSFLGVVVGPGLFTAVFVTWGSYTGTFGLLGIFSTIGVASLFAAMKAQRGVVDS